MRRGRLRVLVPLFAVLAAAVLAAAPASAGGGGCHRPASEARGTTMTLTELCFSPTVLRVAPGSEVTIVNRDTITHPLSRPGGDWFWDGAGAARTTVKLDKPGTYPFFCYAHPGMVGVVVVGDGQGLGAPVVEMAAPASPDVAAAGQQATAAAGTRLPSFPAAWLVLVALAALAGAVAGTRLATRSRAA